MSRFYVEPGQIEGNKIIIRGEDVNHIKNVLRMNIGDEVLISPGNGLVYTTRIESMTTEVVECLIVDCDGGKSELPARITLYQGMPKKDKMDLIVQKAVELGATRIVPVMMERTIVKLDDRRKEEKRLLRWRSISLTAAKQSGRDIIPEVSNFMTFKEAVSDASGNDFNLIPYENAKGMSFARETVAKASGKESIGIFIGPEGGITYEELELAENECGAASISLGHRILRTETAGLALLSVLMFNLDKE